MSKNQDSEMRDSYDFSRGVRGKYAKRFAAGSKVVLIAPDVAKAFTTSDEVNRVLREHLTQRDKTTTVRKRKIAKAQSRVVNTQARTFRKLAK
jgi:hypothetical protein